MNTTRPTKPTRKLSKAIASHRIHSEALELLLSGWAVSGPLWDHGAWIVYPDGAVVRDSGKLPIAASRLILSTEAPVVSVMMNGAVYRKHVSREEKVAYIKEREEAYRRSATRGWADQPGRERDSRLAIADALQALAA